MNDEGAFHARSKRVLAKVLARMGREGERARAAATGKWDTPA